MHKNKKKFFLFSLVATLIFGTFTNPIIRAEGYSTPEISAEIPSYHEESPDQDLDLPEDTTIRDQDNSMSHIPIGVTDAVYSVDFVAGDLKIIHSSLYFDPLVINMEEPVQRTQGFAEILVNDSRGNGSGWDLSVQATNFSLSKTIAGTQETLLLPSDYFSYYVNDVVAINGQDPNGSWEINQTPTFLSNSSNSVISVDQGEGMGLYKLNIYFELSLPDRIHTLSNKVIGVMAGDYRGEIIYTLTSGI